MNKIRTFFITLYKSGAVKYIVVLVVFAVAMIFSQKHNIGQYFRNASTINALEKEKAYYEAETEKNRARLQELKSDKSDLEKFARERYQLKKPGEDVYILSDE